MNDAEECKFIQSFCPVVSRAGTDIGVALRQINEVSGNSIHKNAFKLELKVNTFLDLMYKIQYIAILTKDIQVVVNMMS